MEHTTSAIRYLQNRVATYPISEQQKRREEQTAHILHHNNYPPMTLNTCEKKQQKQNARNQNRKNGQNLTIQEAKQDLSRKYSRKLAYISHSPISKP
jgi:hypothetical protein